MIFRKYSGNDYAIKICLFVARKLERKSIITPAILALTLGVLASICIIVSAFSLSRKIILWAMLLTNVLTGTQFILLNETATTYLISISLIYSVLLMVESHFPVVRTPLFTAAVLLSQTIGYFAINGFTANWGLLALAGTIIGTLAMWFENPVQLKITMMVMGFIWLGYQLAAGAYGQIPGELVFLAGITVSIVMLLKAKKNGVPLTEVEELPTLIRRKIAERRLSKETELAFT